MNTDDDDDDDDESLSEHVVSPSTADISCSSLSDLSHDDDGNNYGCRENDDDDELHDDNHNDEENPSFRLQAAMRVLREARGLVVCAICSQPFETGQPVYESNNPQCQHTHHKTCMDKWLVYQNTCPVCHQPFVLCTPSDHAAIVDCSVAILD
jgi:hypothetical protein